MIHNCDLLPTRITSSEEFQPEEYDAVILWEGWETETGTPLDTRGWDITVADTYHGVVVEISFDKDLHVTTRVRKT